MDQKEYDKEIEVLRGCIDRLMDIGSDDHNSTGNDIKEIVDQRIQEAKEG